MGHNWCLYLRSSFFVHFVFDVLRLVAKPWKSSGVAPVALLASSLSLSRLSSSLLYWISHVHSVVARCKHTAFCARCILPADLPIQYVTWLPINDKLGKEFDNSIMNELGSKGYPSISTAISEAFKNHTERLLKNFPSKSAEQQSSIESLFRVMRNMPDTYWETNDTILKKLRGAIKASTLSSVFIRFDIDGYKREDETDGTKHPASSDNSTDFSIGTFDEQLAVTERISMRAKTVVWIPIFLHSRP